MLVGNLMLILFDVLHYTKHSGVATVQGCLQGYLSYFSIYPNSLHQKHPIYKLTTRPVGTRCELVDRLFLVNVPQN